MSDAFLSKLHHMMRELPSFITVGDAGFEASRDTVTGYIHLALNETGSPSCDCGVNTVDFAYATARELFDIAPKWAKCMVDLKPTVSIPGYFEKLSDYMPLFELAMTLENLPSWDSVDFLELMGFAKALASLDLFYLLALPQFSSDQARGYDDTEMFQLLPGATLGSVGAFDLSGAIVKRLSTEFYTQTLNCLSALGESAPVEVPASLEREFFMFDNKQAIIRTEVKIFTGGNFAASADYLLELLMLPYLLTLHQVGETDSKVFSFDARLRPSVRRATFAPMPIFTTPEPVTESELGLIIQFAEMYLEKTQVKTVTKAGEIFNGVYTREILKPAWASFKASTK